MEQKINQNYLKIKQDVLKIQNFQKIMIIMTVN